MKRYVISPIIGTGSEQNQFRAAVEDLAGVNSHAIIPSKPDGSPKFRFALCIVSTANLPAVAAVSNTYVFPDFPLDATLDGMDATTRNAMRGSVQAYDLDGNGLHFDASNADSDSFRALVVRLLQQLEPAFNNLDTFDVAEVSS